MLQLTHVQTPDEVETLRGLLREYQQSLGIDLCFQDFEAELSGLPGSYAPPEGRLLLARLGGAPVGCIALQRVNTSRCEMKRLYVRPNARGLGVGLKLVQRILDEAQRIGYAKSCWIHCRA